MQADTVISVSIKITEYGVIAQPRQTQIGVSRCGSALFDESPSMTAIPESKREACIRGASMGAHRPTVEKNARHTLGPTGSCSYRWKQSRYAPRYAYSESDDFNPSTFLTQINSLPTTKPARKRFTVVLKRRTLAHVFRIVRHTFGTAVGRAMSVATLESARIVV